MAGGVAPLFSPPRYRPGLQQKIEHRRDFAHVLPCFAPGFGMTLDHSSGIICHEPAQNPDHTFRETLCMGYTRYSPREVGRLATRTWKSVCFQVEDGP